MDASTWNTLRLVVLILVLLLFISLNFLLYPQSSLSGAGYRYLLIPILVCIGMILSGAGYIQYTYGLKRYSHALQYFLAVLFGINYPYLRVRDGVKQVDLDEENLIDVIGGPGILVIQPGSAVLLESYTGKVRALGSGRHFITRQERIKEVFTLEEQGSRVEKLSAMTRDGIQVDAREVRYRYRLIREGEPSASVSPAMHSPYAFSEQAALNMAYNRVMNDREVLSWQSGIENAINSGITDYISAHTVDELTAPEESGIDPRSEIQARIKFGSVRERLLERGTELIWIDIGHFDVADKQVAEQRVSSWQARWAVETETARTRTDAQRLIYREMGRAKGQVDMLNSIVDALKDFESSEDPQQHMRKVALVRIAQLIDAMRDQVHDTEPEALPGGGT
ncbi:MAG: hypothetical protein JXB15_15585 [Anaerolineales bacterium]|nr:hypothetical protein [Anaerolineales bacterium]